jgi:hypothetical protein
VVAPVLQSKMTVVVSLKAIADLVDDVGVVLRILDDFEV